MSLDGKLNALEQDGSLQQVADMHTLDGFGGNDMIVDAKGCSYIGKPGPLDLTHFIAYRLSGITYKTGNWIDCVSRFYNSLTIFFREQADPAKRKIVLPKN